MRPIARGWAIKIKKQLVFRVVSSKKELIKSRGSLIKY
jgi:hypothetical protein